MIPEQQFLTAAGMLLVGLAWNPRSGGGLGVFFARYLFSIGLPVERWLRVLAELSQLEARPERFLSEAVVALARLPAVSGVAWRSGEARGERGAATPDAVEFANSEIALTIRSAIGQKLKISVSEGIGSNKLVSAIASKLKKPAAFIEVTLGQVVAPSQRLMKRLRGLVEDFEQILFVALFRRPLLLRQLLPLSLPP